MIVTERIRIQTKGRCDIIDITQKVAEHVAASGIKDGSVTVFITGSTAGITTIEYESGLIDDFKAMWERLAPEGALYEHNQRWNDGNGYSHVRASLLGASLVVPIEASKMMLGTWQQIVVVDFDNRPRSRQIVIQIYGE